jgi:hypothetical protein
MWSSGWPTLVSKLAAQLENTANQVVVEEEPRLGFAFNANETNSRKIQLKISAIRQESFPLHMPAAIVGEGFIQSPRRVLIPHDYDTVTTLCEQILRSVGSAKQ